MATDNPAHEAIVNWWRELPKFLRYGGTPKPNACDSQIARSISDMALRAIWSNYETLDRYEVQSWINTYSEELLRDNTSEIILIKGEAIKNLIVDCQNHNLYVEISNQDLWILSHGVVLLAMGETGGITADQMFCSNAGLSPRFDAQFLRTPILKLK